MSRLSFEVGTYRRKPPTDVGSEAEPDPMEEILELAAKPLDVELPDAVQESTVWNWQNCTGITLATSSGAITLSNAAL